MNKRSIYFKENIRRMFLYYAIVPVSCIACLCLLILFLVWKHGTERTNQSANQFISEEMDNILNAYVEELNFLSDQTDLVRKKIDTDTRVEVFQRIYYLRNQLGYRANIYIFDSQMYPCLMSTAAVPTALKGGSNLNWGIVRELNQEPEKAALKIIRNLEENNAELFIGKAIVEENTIIGYAIFSFSSKDFQMLLTKSVPQTVIMDETGNIFIANNYEFCDNIERFDRRIDLKNGYVHRNGKQYYLTNTRLPNGKLRVCTITNTGNEFHSILIISFTIVAVLIATTVLVHFSADKMTQKSTRDIDVIVDAFEKVNEGQLDTYIDINSSVEFQSIGESYNIMLDSLKQQIQRNKEMVELVAFAQIKQLESQFNPHFLFNTLENIRFMCKIEPKSADKMIIALSSLLRYSISNAEEYITVREDIENTECYLSILKIRFNRRFTYQVDLEENILDCLIPKLLIQPLIENAIKYGFKDRENLLVEIHGFEENGNLIVLCKDNGAGIDVDTLELLRYNLTQEKNKSNHLGIYNIHRRIQLKYKGNYGIQIHSIRGEGTILRISLPINRRGEETC